MSEADRQRWERKHESPSSAPARKSMAWIPAAERAGALALDVACGQGRHARALLDACYDVVGVDIASTALDAARRRCTHAHRTFMPIQADLEHWPFLEERFDLVVQVDFLDRRLFDAIKRSTRRGGLVLVDTFRAGPAGHGHRPANPDYLLREAELDRLFDGWDVLAAENLDTPVARAAILARRPLEIL